MQVHANARKPATKPAHHKPAKPGTYGFNHANNVAWFQWNAQNQQRTQALALLSAISQQLGGLLGQFLGGAPAGGYPPAQPAPQPVQQYQPAAYQPALPQPALPTYRPVEQPVFQPAAYYSNTTAWGGWGAAAGGYYNS